MFPSQINFDGDCTSIAAIKQNTNKQNNRDKKIYEFDCQNEGM
jgi:hypothetical protein